LLILKNANVNGGLAARHGKPVSFAIVDLIQKSLLKTGQFLFENSSIFAEVSNSVAGNVNFKQVLI